MIKALQLCRTCFYEDDIHVTSKQFSVPMRSKLKPALYKLPSHIILPLFLLFRFSSSICSFFKTPSCSACRKYNFLSVPIAALPSPEWCLSICLISLWRGGIFPKAVLGGEVCVLLLVKWLSKISVFVLSGLSFVMERMNLFFSKPVLFHTGRLFSGGRDIPGWLKTLIGDIGGETLDEGECPDNKSILNQNWYVPLHQDAVWQQTKLM